MHDRYIVGVCILSGDGGWQVRGVVAEDKGRQDESLWDTILEATYHISFVVAGGKGEAAIANQLHDHADHVPVR